MSRQLVRLFIHVLGRIRAKTITREKTAASTTARVAIILKQSEAEESFRAKSVRRASTIAATSPPKNPSNPKIGIESPRVSCSNPNPGSDAMSGSTANIGMLTSRAIQSLGAGVIFPNSVIRPKAKAGLGLRSLGEEALSGLQVQEGIFCCRIGGCHRESRSGAARRRPTFASNTVRIAPADAHHSSLVTACSASVLCRLRFTELFRLGFRDCRVTLSFVA